MKTLTKEQMDKRYKGYWIKRNPLNGYMWIEKDGFSLGSVTTVEEAERLINQLVD